MYAPWACYMSLRALYNPKPPMWPFIGHPGLAGDRSSLTQGTPRDAVTNALRLHVHIFSFKTFKSKTPLFFKVLPKFPHIKLEH